MQYVLIFAEPASEFAKRDDPEAAPGYWGAWSAYIGALQASGVMTSGNGLQPPAQAATLRLRDGRREVQDGPFADAREMIGGYVVIETPDLETALAWAEKSPVASAGAVEVRAVLPPPPAA
jgi:hypothetical protein